MALPCFVALAVVATTSARAAAEGEPQPSPTVVPMAPAPASPEPAAAAPAAPPLDESALLTLAALRREAAVAATRSAGATANAIARTTLAAAQARLDQASAALGPVAAEAEAADEARTAARARRERVESQLAVVLSETFQLSSTSADVMAEDPLTLLEGGDRFADRSNSAAFGEVALRTLRQQLLEARDATASADAVHAAAIGSLTTAQVEQAAATAAVSVADAEVQRVAADAEAAVERARTSGQPEPVGADGPSIMGTSVVSAVDMAAFVQSRGHPHPSVDLVQLARAFLVEGDLEGVRGDIAFVQAIIETGWFSFHNSMVDPEDHNYAGIGACDSCSDGFGYPTMELGVRAQIQLLAAYAQPGITSADYARPAVRTVPERLGVRGCCGTWMALSGVWATGPGYGQKILKLYNELLASAVARAAAH